ncbi:MAG: sensor histidine kinase, partial [Verrucomicrobia bacterium]|nr:sensor histidine kinase [Verrucomicrobiota bacterium]
MRPLSFCIPTRLLFQWTLCGWIWTCVSATAFAAGSELVLTNAGQVRSLKTEEAARQAPVHLRGVVLMCGNTDLTIRDETAAIYLQAATNVFAVFHRGDLVDIEGVSDPGKFAPMVQVTKALKIGTAPIPDPQPATFDELLIGRWDAQWVEVVGVVRRIGPAERYPDIVELWLATGGGLLPVSLSKEEGAKVAVDSAVRIRRVCFYRFNIARQALSPVLSVPPDEPVVVRAPAPVAPEDIPLRSIASLMRFDPEEVQGHRVRVRGVVTHVEPEHDFWIHDVQKGLRVDSPQTGHLAAGTEVEVLGFVSRGGYTPVLEDAVYRELGTTTPPIPSRLAWPAQALERDADLVELDATIQEQWLALDGCRLRLVDGTNGFSALLRLRSKTQVPKDWSPRSRVRIRGICMVNAGTPGVTAGTIDPQSFEILLRSPSDLQVLQPPPWWTPEHVAWVLGFVIGALLLAVLGVVWNHRRHIREQVLARAKSEAEFAAVWNERNRIACELHDTLAQGLGAISMQLEVVKRNLPPHSGARVPLDEARLLARSNLAEARQAIWNMRSQVLETGDLSTALRDILRSMTEGTKTRSELFVRGNVRRLAPVTENNVLRIGQEAITNAAKHANADRIEVVLEFAKRQVQLSVLDDGCGF